MHHTPAHPTFVLQTHILQVVNGGGGEALLVDTLGRLLRPQTYGARVAAHEAGHLLVRGRGGEGRGGEGRRWWQAVNAKPQSTGTQRDLRTLPPTPAATPLRAAYPQHQPPPPRPAPPLPPPPPPPPRWPTWLGCCREPTHSARWTHSSGGGRAGVATTKRFLQYAPATRASRPHLGVRNATPPPHPPPIVSTYTFTHAHPLTPSLA